MCFVVVEEPRPSRGPEFMSSLYDDEGPGSPDRGPENLGDHLPQPHDPFEDRVEQQEEDGGDKEDVEVEGEDSRFPPVYDTRRHRHCGRGGSVYPSPTTTGGVFLGGVSTLLLRPSVLRPSLVNHQERDKGGGSPKFLLRLDLPSLTSQFVPQRPDSLYL